MRPNPQFHVDLVTFTEEIFNGKLYFLCSGIVLKGFRTLNLIVLLTSS